MSAPSAPEAAPAPPKEPQQPKEPGQQLERYDHIGLTGQTVGSLTFTNKTLEWRSSRTDAHKILLVKDIARATWTVFGKWGHLRIFLENNKSYRFDSFLRGAYERLHEIFTSKYHVSLEKEELQAGGGNYGDMTLEGTTLMIKLDERPLLELPLNSVSQCVLPGNIKNEVQIQFTETDAADRDEDALVEVRFYVPPAEGEDEENAAAKLQSDILERTNIQSAAGGEAIVTFPADMGNFMYPRGRYEIQLYANMFRIHGTKYDHKMAYDDVIHYFLLERPDKTFVFIIGLSKPIRQGQQRYSYLVLQTTDEPGEASVNLEESELREKYPALDLEMKGPIHHMIAKTFRALSSKRVYQSSKFESAVNKGRAVRCALKAAEGLLFPMEKAFMFVSKPTMYLAYNDIERIMFDRVSSTSSGLTKNFDLRLTMGSGGDRKEYVFSNIDRAELRNLSEFLGNKRVHMEGHEDAAQAPQALAMSSEDEDEEGEGGEDEDEEEDEDYRGSDDDDDSGGSGSDSDSDSGVEMVEERAEGAAKKKKEKRKRGADDGEEGTSKKKGKKKAKVEEDDGKKKRKKRAKKDPNAPKRPLSAYMLFCQDNRARVKQENPDMKMTELSKVLGDEWKNKVSADDKKRYDESAKEAKKKYDEAMKEYKAKKKEENQVEESDADESDASSGGSGSGSSSGSGSGSDDDEDDD